MNAVIVLKEGPHYIKDAEVPSRAHSIFGWLALRIFARASFELIEELRKEECPRG